jgi:hypothetical protein
MTAAAQIIGGVALLVILCILMLWAFPAWGPDSKAPVSSKGPHTRIHRLTNSTPPSFRHLTDVPAPRSPFRFRLPMEFHDSVPMVSVWLEGQSRPFLCVADTGSLQLNVSADVCEVCDGTRGVFESTDALRAASEEWLRYGTQHDVVKKIDSAVRLHTDAAFVPIPLCVTVKRAVAESNYNVAGLLQHGDDCLLSRILPADHSLYIRILEGRGFFGGLETAAAQQLAAANALVVAPLLPSETRFYMVRLTGIRMGGRRIRSAAKYLIIDTGSNMTSFPKAVYDQMLPGLWQREPLTLEIAGQPLTINAPQYCWMGGPDLMVDDDLAILHDDPEYVIWGAHLMQLLNLVFVNGELVVTSAAPDAHGRVPDDAFLQSR